MEYSFVTLDVFTDRVFGGNPLAVILNGQGLSDAQMQSVAREFNLSETTFVFQPEDKQNTHRVRIFTPAAELPFAGHPTVGTAVALALEEGKNEDSIQYVFEEGVGAVPVSVTRSDTGALSAQFAVAQLPTQIEAHASQSAWAEILSLDTNALAENVDSGKIWSCGASSAFVAVNSLASLNAATIDLTAWQRHLAGRTTTGVYVFTTETGDDDIDVRARMFAPGHGITEDPATGSAVAALAGWLVKSEHPEVGSKSWTIAQGIEMGRPSLLKLEADILNSSITAVRVGGKAVPVSRSMITVS